MLDINAYANHLAEDVEFLLKLSFAWLGQLHQTLSGKKHTNKDKVNYLCNIVLAFIAVGSWHLCCFALGVLMQFTPTTVYLESPMYCNVYVQKSL